MELLLFSQALRGEPPNPIQGPTSQTARAGLPVSKKTKVQ